MEDFDFYSYDEEKDKIKIYSDEIQEYFQNKYNIIIESLDFDDKQNVILYINQRKNDKNFSEKYRGSIEKKLIKNIKHLNDVEIRDMKIILTFSSVEVELY